MSGSCKEGTPHGKLIEQLLNSNTPKSEREWAAAREIARLRNDNEQIIKNCLTIAEVEKIHKEVIRKIIEGKE